jgi:hypothetical protein
MHHLTWQHEAPAADDASLVPDLADRLRVSELELFGRAYEAWFGRAALDREIEPAFAGYVLRRELPFWVRHHLRCMTDGAAVAPASSGPGWRTVAANLLPERERFGLWDIFALILATGLCMHLLGF